MEEFLHALTLDIWKGTLSGKSGGKSPGEMQGGGDGEQLTTSHSFIAQIENQQPHPDLYFFHMCIIHSSVSAT